MTVSAKTIVLVLFTIFFLVGAWTKLRSSSFSSSTPQSYSSETIAYETRTHDAGSVTLHVTPQQLAVSTLAIFTITFDTHSVNLDFDVASSAQLVDDRGRSYGSPTWEGSPPGGHHREGTLSFSDPLSPDAKTVTLTISNVAGVPTRMFTWDLK